MWVVQAPALPLSDDNGAEVPLRFFKQQASRRPTGHEIKKMKTIVARGLIINSLSLLWRRIVPRWRDWSAAGMLLCLSRVFQLSLREIVSELFGCCGTIKEVQFRRESDGTQAAHASSPPEAVQAALGLLALNLGTCRFWSPPPRHPGLLRA